MATGAGVAFDFNFYFNFNFKFKFKGGFAAPASLAFRRLPFINRDKRKQKRSDNQQMEGLQPGSPGWFDVETCLR